MAVRTRRVGAIGITVPMAGSPLGPGEPAWLLEAADGISARLSALQISATPR